MAALWSAFISKALSSVEQGKDPPPYLRAHTKKEERGPFCIYLGADQTDEDAFSAVGQKGISIRLGSEQRTSACYSLRNIKEVQKFLRWMIDHSRQ